MSGDPAKTTRRRTRWIEVVPYGVTVAADRSRPLMLFKDKEGEDVLPVWMSPLEAGIALAQQNRSGASGSPHDLTDKILHGLGVRLRRVYFREQKGPHQYIDLEFEGHPELKYVRCRADHALSFCLFEKAPFYSTRDFMRQARDQQAQLEEPGVAIETVEVPDGNSHYLM